MAKQSRIAIVGAGPAGSSLAIRLARAGLEVTLIDKDVFPRHKLCGEFISPECLALFEDLGIKSSLLERGGDRIHETRFYSPGGRSVTVPTEWFGSGSLALSLSRAEMDLALWQAAIDAGANTIENARVVAAETVNGLIKHVQIRDGDGSRSEIVADLFIDATGRSGALSRLAKSDERSDPKHAASILAFKAHLEGVTPQRGTCEIYVFDGGYGGLSHVENGSANFCFLVKAKVARKFIGNTNLLFRYILESNPRAGERMKDATPTHDWLAVTIERFGTKGPPNVSNLISVGDAAAFIDPFTGSGMLMALESAKLASDFIAGADFSVSEYHAAHRRMFRSRLAVSSVLRRAALSQNIATAAIALTSVSDRFRELLARATRPRNEAANSNPR